MNPAAAISASDHAEEQPAVVALLAQAGARVGVDAAGDVRGRAGPRARALHVARRRRRRRDRAAAAVGAVVDRRVASSSVTAP